MTLLRGVKSGDGTRLTVWGYASEQPEIAAERPAVLLLHGPLGRANTWWQTVRWLVSGFRVFVLEQRGRGPVSDEPVQRPPGLETAVGDAKAVVDHLELGPVVVVGHFLGAVAGWRLAARHPELVCGMVSAEMRAAPLTAGVVSDYLRWVGTWPVPFASLGAVRRWFAEEDPWLEGRARPGRGDYFLDVMRGEEDGYRPWFPLDWLPATLNGYAHEARWEELAEVRCPTLVARGLHGSLGRAEAQEMVRVLPRGSYAEVPSAGHLLHAEQPEAWRRAVQPFLTQLATRERPEPAGS